MRGTRTPARFVGGLLLSAVLLSARQAPADERTEARTHFKKGMAAIADGHYDQAIEELKKAYAILPHPNVLYNIAHAYVDIGDLDDAITYYRRYLESNPADREDVVQIVAGLESRVRKQRTQLLETMQPPGGGVPAPPEVGAAGAEAGRGEAGRTPTTPGSAEPGGGGMQPGPPAPPGGESPNTVNATPPAEHGAGALKTEEVFEETVVTASKAAQSPLDAPNSTSIITEQDIRLSGITKIPELLRRLAGVDIMETTSAQTEVSLRGFNQRLSNKVLVLVNGRSVYVDLIGATLWGLLSIGVEDVQRIEVVRGPGSALYGADAFNGVINIITKQPGEGGAGLHIGYGSLNASHGTIWASQRDKDTAYRISAGYDYLPRWSREVPPDRADVHLATSDQDASQRTVRLDATLTRKVGSNATAGLQGGYSYGSYEILSIGGELDHVLSPVQSSDVTAFLQSKHVEARVFWNRIVASQEDNAAYFGQSLLPAQSLLDVVDGEFRLLDQFETGSGIDHHLQIGTEYRLKAVQWSYQARDEVEHHAGIFLHDEVKFGARLAAIADYRADYVPFLDRIVQSARGTILSHPSKRSTVRGILGTAFRTPTFLESYLDIPFQLPVTAGALLTQSKLSHVEPEQILSTELGYLNSDNDYVTFDSALFYNHATNLIEIAPIQPVTLGDVSGRQIPTSPDSSTGLYPLFFNGFENECQSYGVYGGELGVRTFPAEGLDVYANYTLMYVRQDNSGCSPARIALLSSDARTSAHKLNAGIQVRTVPRIDGSVDFHYVSPQDWAEQVTDSQTQRLEYKSYHLDAYALVNARIGYRFRHNHLEVSGVVFNLLDDRHREHPFGQFIARRFMAFLDYRF